METKKIKDWISGEYHKGNKTPFKEIYRFIVRLYRFENKELVKEWNKNYYFKKSLKGKSEGDKIKKPLKEIKKPLNNNDVEIKKPLNKTPSNMEDIF